MDFCFEQVIGVPLHTVFAFHCDPRNLAVLMHNGRGFRLLHHDGNIFPGSQTWVEHTVLGFIPVVMGFRHTLYEPPVRFGEEMIHGPFAQFVHHHEFEGRGEMTLVRDRLQVLWPTGYGGASALRHLVAPHLHKVFAFRQRMLARLVAQGVVSELASPAE